MSSVSPVTIVSFEFMTDLDFFGAFFFLLLLGRWTEFIELFKTNYSSAPWLSVALRVCKTRK